MLNSRSIIVQKRISDLGDGPKEINQNSQVLVAHTCNPSYLGGCDRIVE
jgi:hypothetical protein